MVNLFKVLILIIISLAIAYFFLNTTANESQHLYGKKQSAIPVEVATIKEQSIRLWKEFSGRLTAVDYVEIKPQATGLITEVKFEDGQFVNKGDILYVIDPKPLKAILAIVNADLIAAQSRYRFAEKELQRAIDLVQKNLISEQVYDERLNAKLLADAAVEHAKAELTRAQIDLSHAYVRAPISGLISRTELTEGNLVSADSDAPLLTSVVSIANIYADFEVDEQTYLRFTQGGFSNNKTAAKNPVELRLQNGDLLYQGQIHSFDNKIDPTSGTIRARAIFDNSQCKLLPGMYARLKLGSVSEENTILVNERAIGTDQNRKFVYVVNDDNKTAYREVQLGDSIDGDRVVHSGLSVGDKVIVHGLMRIQPNMPVVPKEQITAHSKSVNS